jgi:hypothetical protein
VFSINTMSASGFRVLCTSSHCLCAVHTCRARRRHVVRASGSCCFARVVACRSRVSRVLFAHVVARRSRVSCASPRVARACRAYLVCRTASTRDNKLFALISIHVNNVNLSGLIF